MLKVIINLLVVLGDYSFLYGSFRINHSFVWGTFIISICFMCALALLGSSIKDLEESRYV